MTGRNEELVDSILIDIMSSGGNVTLNELSSQYCLHRSHLSRIFRKTYGRNFRRIRSNARLRSIFKFVKSTHLSVKEIAARVGLHPDYLGALFKETTGMTVREYRNLLQFLNKAHDLRKKSPHLG